MRLLTLARDLGRRKGREKQGLFIVEGTRAVEELLKSPLTIRGLLYTTSALSAPRERAVIDAFIAKGVDTLEVTEKDFATAAETEAPQGILAVAEIPDRSLARLQVEDNARVIMLDAVQDPGNTGTIIRTAAALGATAVVALPGTVDPWNAKVIRGSMGASFHLPVMSASWDEVDALRERASLTFWGTDVAGSPLGSTNPPPRLALILGNEGAGLSENARRRVDATISLPIGSAVESLNVSVAAGIFLYQLRS